jgi:hypothetical protein
VFAHRQRNRAIVVAAYHYNANPRMDFLILEELQRMPVTLVNTGKNIFRALL